MKIKSLYMQNFMPYKGVQDVEFPQHETQNVMLLFGDNMRGKTSFLNSIRWAFYGIALGRHLRIIPRINLVNKDAGDEGEWVMSIRVLFEHEGKLFELKRSIEKRENVSRPRNDADFTENIGLRIDGTPVSGDLINNQINQIMPKEVSRFFLFDGELLQEYENLLVEESEQGKKIKEHIESVLGVPALIHGRDELQVLLKEARSAQRKDAQKNQELRAYAQEQKSYEVKLESIEKDLLNLNIQKEDMQEKVDKLVDYLKNTEAVQSKKIELSALEADEKHLKQKIIDSNERIHSLLKTVWKDVLANSVHNIVEELKSKRKEGEQKLQESIALKGKIEGLRKTIDENKVCDTCGQNIPDNQMKPLKLKLEKLLQVQDGASIDFDKVTELSSTIDNLETIRSEGETNRIVTELNDVTRAKVALMSVDNKRDDIKKEIEGFDTEEIMRKREEKERWDKQLARITEHIKENLTSREENIKKQEKISELIAKHQGSMVSKSNQRVNILQQLEVVFTAGIDKLREKLKKDVESHATDTFKKLTTEETYAGLQINQNYGLAILDQDGAVLRERSAGAEQVVALSLIDGLNKTSGIRAPIVMDTPLGRLDPKHRKNILQYLPNMSEQIVLLVHEGEIHAKRDTEIFASRIGVRYEIKRISATQSRIEKVM